MKKVAALLVIAFFLIAATACADHALSPELSSRVTEPGDIENPFAQDDSNTVILGGISHLPQNPNVDENKELLPWIYDGQDVQIDYTVNAYGQAKNVGFLIFVDGEPQPYKIDQDEAALEFMHTFELKEDNVDLNFSFIFSPVTGKQGDILDLTIASIYNPGFIPDMESTSSYGGYQTILPAAYQLRFEEDAQSENTSLNAEVPVFHISEEPVTDALMESIQNSGMQEIDSDTFNNEIFSLIYYDDALRTDNYKINGNTLHVTYKLCGHAGLEYITTFYINHKPISSADLISVNTAIKKGAASVIEFDIDTNKLSDFNTFYAVSIPRNARDYPDGLFDIIKTPSILFYK